MEAFISKVTAFLLACSFIFVSFPAQAKGIRYILGDPNATGKVDVADIVCLISYLFKGGNSLMPLESGNVNCDGKVSVADVVYLINCLFKGGPPPCEP